MTPPKCSIERLRSFGRRRTKRLQGQRAERLEALATLGVATEGSIDPAVLFPFPPTELRLEIGFGGGEHLAAQAARHPEVGFIGCEPFMDGVSKLIADIQERNLKNIRIHAEDARSLLDRLPEAGLSAVYILFPDPWPKRRHHKRRLVNAELLSLLARVMRPGGTLLIATDHADYTEWMLLHLLADARFRWTATKPEDFAAPPKGWIETRYRQKAARAGRISCFLVFKKE